MGGGGGSSFNYFYESNLGEINDEDNYYKNMAKRKSQGDRGTMVTASKAGGGTRLVMSTITTRGVGDEEGRRRGRIGSKTVELNQNQNTDQDRS